ncbi:hypothetical protein OPT61_g8990 [Boeremia exigua]|uniref:Uncharacterized protein n=1 Tax=Boeremia exigua TaxID=749465 RepID=A0ACC2HW78_9PLEO|nr:hypothetical protein OPT61_g8990 [Boeremia exigua]
MATFIDMSWKVDEDRRKRAIAEAANAEHVEVSTVTHESNHNGVDSSQPSTAPTTAERDTLQRLGWRQRVKEVFHPALRKKRALDEFALSQRVHTHMAQPIEPPSLPGTGRERLSAFKEYLESRSPSDEWDEDVLREDYDDDEITALPRMPGHRGTQARQESLLPWDEPSNEPFQEEFDQAMDEAFALADAPGNRSSTRPALPAEWMANVSRKRAVGSANQHAPVRRTNFLPLPSAVSLPGSVPLPDCVGVADSTRPSTGNRPATVRGEAGTIYEARMTPALSRWFEGLEENHSLGRRE